jgi:7-cyano-7-deazaguanine synthase in queuosine biosynthesis
MSNEIVDVSIRWPGMKKTRTAQIDCVITQDIRLSPNALQDYSAKLLSGKEQDLVIVAGSVAYADRMVRRKRAKGWARHIALTIPVSKPAFWNKPETFTPLLDSLEYVSGDQWVIHFVQGPEETLAKKQTSLDFTLDNYVVLPFSDGLDSFLQWQLLKKETPALNILRVHTSSRASNHARNALIDGHGDKSDQRLAMPISLAVGAHPEPTYRTRTFLFFIMAALAAHKFKAKKVIVGENGVGMLGPGMIPFGDECPHRTTHPAFTRRLSAFINRVIGSRIEFDHPQLFRTKGQVLAHALRYGVTGWQKTHSCTRGPRTELDGMPCGICGGCLLRRTAVHAAGQPDGQYFWNDLSGGSLDDCRANPASRAMRPSDIDIGVHGVTDMSCFAELAQPMTSPEIFDRAAWELIGKPDASLATTARQIKELVDTHALEWSAFRAKFSENGFLNAC